MVTDEWMEAALTDDAVVVELLFRLKQSSESVASQHGKPPPRWGHRKPRSKSVTATSRKELESMRCSPTTPLSWSCGGGSSSPSDGPDESSRPSDRSSGSRSKCTSTSEITATTSINKRFRRKKTFADLKEEESLLLKERIHLKKELATLNVTLKEQKARNENLKRLKLELHLQSAYELKGVNSLQPELTQTSTSDRVLLSPKITTHQHLLVPNSCKLEKEVEIGERCFVLPDLNMIPSDLNMIPSEEDFICGTLYGLS